EIIRTSSATFATLFRLLGDPDNYPLVVHCAGGRDRTGVACALMLSVAGVSRADVIEDYMLSTELLRARYAMHRQEWIDQGVDPEPIMANTALRPAFIEATLDALDADYGGAESYLRAAGVGAEELAVFRKELAAG